MFKASIHANNRMCTLLFPFWLSKLPLLIYCKPLLGNYRYDPSLCPNWLYMAKTCIVRTFSASSRARNQNSTVTWLIWPDRLQVRKREKKASSTSLHVFLFLCLRVFSAHQHVSIASLTRWAAEEGVLWCVTCSSARPAPPRHSPPTSSFCLG